MTPNEWWKNFALGIELDVAGTFIFNGIKRLDEIENFYSSTDIFEILYNLSVGIERVLKVAVVLIEHDDQKDMESFEKSLITHNLMNLTDRVRKNHNLNLARVHTEFLSLLSKFYKSHRYGRFSIGSVPKITEEKNMFFEYLGKHLQIEIPTNDSYYPLYNTDQIRRFIGKIVKKIARSSYEVICKEARGLNIYTDELRGDSKAIRVFYGERLDFIEDRIKKKELLIFLMHPDSDGDHIDFIRSIDALALDPATVPEYIKALINESNFPMVRDEIEVLYTEIENVSERKRMVDIIGDENVSYE